MKFVGWLKFTFGSFFLNRFAKEAKERSAFNLLLSFILALAFLFVGLIAADIVPFKRKYNGAENFRAVAHSLLRDESGVQLTAQNGAVLTNDGRIINTYTSDTDAEQFAANGYNLVVDTRDPSALCEFDVYATKAGKEFTYEEYCQLTDEQKTEYSLFIRYTDKFIVFSDEQISEFESVIKGVAAKSDDHGKKIATLYASLDTSADNYNEKLYSVYVQAKYKEFDPNSSDFPRFTDYYYYNYISDGKHSDYLIILNDKIAVSFISSTGVRVEFVGTYADLADGKVGDIDKLIVSSYFAAVPSRMLYYLMNIMRLFPFFIIATVVLTIFMIICDKFAKYKNRMGYTGHLKTIMSFAIIGSFISAIVTMLIGFAASFATVCGVTLVIYFAIIVVRMLFYYIPDRKRRIKEESENNDR